MYRFSGTITLEDYIQFNESFRRKLSKKAHIVLFSAFVGLIVTIYILGLLEWDSDDEIGPVEAAAYCVVLILFWPLLVWLSKIANRLLWKNHFRSNKSRDDGYTYSIDEREIVVESENSRTVITREKVHKITMDEDSVYIFTAIGMANIVKARYFATRDEYEEVREYIVKNYAST